MYCRAIHELNNTTKTIHLRIATLSSTEWAFDAFICIALSIPPTHAVKGRIDGYQELSTSLSCQAMDTNVEIGVVGLTQQESQSTEFHIPDHGTQFAEGLARVWN